MSLLQEDNNKTTSFISFDETKTLLGQGQSNLVNKLDNELDNILKFSNGSYTKEYHAFIMRRRAMGIITDDEIDTVMTCSKCTREKAIIALRQTNGSLGRAIRLLWVPTSIAKIR